MRYTRLSRFIKDNRGQALVEFALAAVIFFSLLFLIMDLGLMFYVQFTMQNAVREGARYAVTGRTDAGPNQRTSVINTIINKSNGLYDKHPTSTTFWSVDPTNQNKQLINSTNLPGSDPIGAGGQIIVVQLQYRWPLLTPFLRPFFLNGEYSFTVAATMRNEVI